MTTLKTLMIAAALGYAGLLAVAYLFQRAIMYPAPQSVRTAPAAAGYPQAQEHVLDTADGEKIIVWHVPPQAGKPVVIFFHGNGEVIAWRVPRFRDLAAEGIGVIAVSYRGYGGSTGSPSEVGLIADGEAAYEFTTKLYLPERVALWGYSLGSGVAVALASKHPIGKLILEAPFTSAADIGAAAFPFLPVRWLLKDSFRSDERIGAVRAPLLILHGEKDTVVPIRFGERLLALAVEPKRMERFAQGDHVNLEEQGVLKVAKEFLAN
jgi:pimeloyl-ACP methyl ester carboxylesterase